MLCLRSSWACRTATATATAPTSRRQTRQSSPTTAPGLLTSFSPSSSPHAAQRFQASISSDSFIFEATGPALQQLCGAFLAWGCHSATRIQVVSSFFPLSFGPTRFDQRCAVPVNLLHFYAVAVIYICFLFSIYLLVPNPIHLHNP